MAATRRDPAQDTSDREIVITRLIGAPRELVFEAWTDIRHLGNWWGPRGFSTTTHEYDFRPGGMWRFVMHGPNGMDFPNWIAYEEIVPPERLVYSHGGGRADGSADFHTTVLFETQGKKTLVTMRGVFPSAAERDLVVKEYGAVEGGKQNLERLEEQVARMAAGKPFILTREFDAPRDLVFRVWTEAEHLTQWFGPKGTTIRTSKMDFRQGGQYLYCMVRPDGNEMWGKWSFREIVKPEKIVLIQSFSDENGGVTRAPMNATWPLETLSTTTFTEKNGRTTLSLEWCPINATEEEIQTFAAAFEGMTMGWSGTMEQLTDYLHRYSSGSPGN